MIATPPPSSAPSLADRVGVVIVNWNTRTQLLRCLDPLTQGPSDTWAVSLLVVDNGSTDGSVAAVQESHPHVRVLANPTNVGYAAAINQALPLLHQPYLLIANADVECSPKAIEQLANFLESHPRAAIAGPKLTDSDGALQLSWGRIPSLTNEFLQRWWWRRLERQPGQRALRRIAAHPRAVDWVLGACLMIRRQVFLSLGGFDERYFMYFEEVDFCTRARQVGWEIWYVPDAVVVHEGRASTRQRPDEMSAAYRQSQLRFYRRFHGPWEASCLRGYLWMKFRGTLSLD